MSNVPPMRAYRSRSVIIKAEDGGFHAALLKTEDEQGIEEEDDNGLYIHGDDDAPLAKHELLEYVIQHDGSVICKWCGETLPSRTHWYRHKYRVHAVNLYKCIKCNMFFKTKKGYIGHISNRHGNEEEEDEEEEGETEIINENNSTSALAESIVDHNTDIENNTRCFSNEIEEFKSSTSVVVTPVCNTEHETIIQSTQTARTSRGSEWEEERQREERLVAEIIDRVRRECEAQGTATLSRRRYTRRSTVMNS